MVERFNWSLLQLLRAYIESQQDWERYLPLVMYAYRTAVHSSTGVSPFVLMYGRSPSTSTFTKSPAFDSLSYPAYLQEKLAELRDFVECNLAATAHSQKRNYDKNAAKPTFSTGDTVWLSVPTAGKLEHRWENGWVITSVKSPTTMQITNGKTTKVVHTNRLQHRYIPAHSDTQPQARDTTNSAQQWTSPTVDHVYLPPPPPSPPTRYPRRERHPPDRYGH